MKLTLFALVGIMMIGSIGVFSFDNVFAQSYSSVLILDPLPLTIKTGDEITFSGQLLTTEGYAIPDSTVYLNDDVDFGSDDVLDYFTTDTNGEFFATWIASPRDSGAWDFFLTYDGASNVSSARSVTYSVVVSDYADSNSSGMTDISTSIIFDKIPSSAYAGESITFTGKLYADGSPFPNAFVQILEDDPGFDDVLSSGFTDANGNFRLTWNISAGLVETDFDVYAVFDGDSLYDRDRSTNQIISILKHGGSIQLDPIPTSAKIGQPITFSGSLSLNTGSPEGAIVYIKDEDPLDRDDLLATAWVDANGRFSVTWYAVDVDEDYEADIYAVFEGNDVYYRLTTCDSNPTRIFGGFCSNTNPLYISGIYNSPSSPSQQISGEYIEGLFSFDFTHSPLVAIVPSPDSYNEAVRHAGSVQEGILMWKSYLSDSYGGNWNVDFVVITPDQVKFSGKPDVIVNLVTPEQEQGCNTDFYGITRANFANPSKPIQASVCVSSNGNPLPTSQIVTTSGHEFIHAVGLGHAFNKEGDMMCSSENGIPTCPNTYTKSKTPSVLNLAGVVELYGTDGFLNPNKPVPYKTKFISESNYYDQINDLQNDQLTTSPSVQPTDNNVASNEKTTAVETDNSIPTIQPNPDVNLDETFEEIYNENKNTECGYGETLVNGYCLLDQLANEVTKLKDTSSNLIKLELFADGDSAGNHIARDEGKPIQFVGKLLNEKGEPVKNSIVDIVDKQTGVIQTSGVTKGMGDFVMFWKTKTNTDNFVDDKSNWEFVATSKIGSKIVTSETVIVTVTDPTFVPDKIQKIESLEPDKIPVVEKIPISNPVEEKIEVSQPVKQVEEKVEEEIEKEMTCFLFWCW